MSGDKFFLASKGVQGGLALIALGVAVVTGWLTIEDAARVAGFVGLMDPATAVSVVSLGAERVVGAVLVVLGVWNVYARADASQRLTMRRTGVMIALALPLGACVGALSRDDLSLSANDKLTAIRICGPTTLGLNSAADRVGLGEMTERRASIIYEATGPLAGYCAAESPQGSPPAALAGLADQILLIVAETDPALSRDVEGKSDVQKIQLARDALRLTIEAVSQIRLQRATEGQIEAEWLRRRVMFEAAADRYRGLAEAQFGFAPE